MKMIGYIMFFAAALAFLLFPVFALFASPQDQIDIAEAAVWVAQNQFPALDADQFKSATKPPIPDDDDSDGRSETQADTPREDVPESTAEIQAGPVQLLSEAAYQSVQPMRLVLESPVQTAPNPDVMYATIYTGEDVHGIGWCKNCIKLHEQWGDGNEDLKLIWSTALAPKGPQIYPAIRWIGRNGKDWYPSDGRENYVRPASLEMLADIIDKSAGGFAPENHQNVAATGYGGAFHGRRYITDALAYWRQNIGTVPVEFSWKRTGGQTFPLLHQQPDQWTCKNIMGTLGEFSIESPGSKLPVQPIILGYRAGANGKLRLRGEVEIDETQLGFPGDKSNSQATFDSSSQPAGFGPATILTIASTIQALWQILHPSVDLTLGGTVSATCRLDETQDRLTIEFRDCPGVKISAWFQFDLKAKRVVIEPTNIHLDVDGSRLVKSRDIRVEE